MGDIPTKKILVIDDEPQIRKFLRISLGAHGHAVLEAATAGEAVALAGSQALDLIILDLGLPDLDGHEALSRLRDCFRAAIIVLTVRTGEADKIEALDRGADDYVTKPFGIGELMARIDIALRHRAALGNAPNREFRTADLVVDLKTHRVTRGDLDIALTTREFETLRFLVQHAGKVLTHQQILREVWGPAHIHETQYLRVHMGKLRKKLEPEPARPHFIITEPAVGYRFKPAD